MTKNEEIDESVILMTSFEVNLRHKKKVAVKCQWTVLINQVNIKKLFRSCNKFFI